MFMVGGRGQLWDKQEELSCEALGSGGVCDEWGEMEEASSLGSCCHSAPTPGNADPALADISILHQKLEILFFNMKSPRLQISTARLKKLKSILWV